MGEKRTWRWTEKRGRRAREREKGRRREEKEHDNVKRGVEKVERKRLGGQENMNEMEERRGRGEGTR